MKLFDQYHYIQTYAFLAKLMKQFLLPELHNTRIQNVKTFKLICETLRIFQNSSKNRNGSGGQLRPTL